MDMQITSDNVFDDIEHHFKISAGPGAGKTHWLVQHIKNVLEKSKRLGKTRKIACITYTNVAVDTIVKRLGNATHHVEVSTIHSFLYKHLIKPYAKFIAQEYDLNVSKIDGHDEHIVYFKIVEKWIQNHSQKSLFKHPYTEKQLLKLKNNTSAIKKWLGAINYELTLSKDIEIRSDHKQGFFVKEDNSRQYLSKVKCLDILEKDLIEYKKKYWKEGILHHDDILFFSYQIISKCPFVLDVLRAKFPYFFIDEFQDSNPIQVEIIKKISEKETIIGVIGDQAQSIYGFQGADPKQFSELELSEMRNYEMAQNRRSTINIIKTLNSVRSDLSQHPYRKDCGMKPVIFCGNSNDAYNEALRLSNNKKVVTLSRDNITSNAMRREFGDGNLKDKLFSDLKNNDSNKDRRKFVIHYLKGVVFAKERKFKEAIKEIMVLYKSTIEDKEERKKRALKDLLCLLEKYDDYSNDSLMVFYEVVKRELVIQISSPTRGKVKKFYEEHKFQELALCVNIPEDSSDHRTIHKAKGDEFNNVLLVLKKEEDLAFILKHDLEKEEQRIAYVAISRAQERLFISVPTLKQSKKASLSKLFEIKEFKNKELET